MPLIPPRQSPRQPPPSPVPALELSLPAPLAPTFAGSFLTSFRASQPPLTGPCALGDLDCYGRGSGLTPAYHAHNHTCSPRLPGPGASLHSLGQWSPSLWPVLAILCDCCWPLEGPIPSRGVSSGQHVPARREHSLCPPCCWALTNRPYSR